MTRSAFALGLLVLGASALAACDLVLPEEGPELATYYVSANGSSISAVPAKIYVDYMTPQGMKRDSFLGAGRASWSRVFERSALTEFKLTATRAGTGTAGFIGASLFVDGAVVAHDSSSTVASVDAAAPVIESAQ